MGNEEHLSLLAGASPPATREDWEKAAADVAPTDGRDARNTHLRLPTQLVERASTAPPRAAG